MRSSSESDNDKSVTKDLGNEKAFSAFYSPVTVSATEEEV